MLGMKMGVKEIIFLFLLINSLMDLWKRKICIASIPFMVCYGIYYIIKQKIFWFDCLLNIIPGLIIVAISILSQGKIGIGDGIIMIVLGLCWDKYQILLVLMCGFLLAGCFGMILILLKKATKRTELPFLPFLTIVYALSLLAFSY